MILYVLFISCLTDCSAFPFLPPLTPFPTGHQLPKAGPLPVSFWLESLVQPWPGASDHAAVRLGLSLPQCSHQSPPADGGALHAVGRYYVRGDVGGWFSGRFPDTFALRSTVALTNLEDPENATRAYEQAATLDQWVLPTYSHEPALLGLDFSDFFTFQTAAL